MIAAGVLQICVIAVVIVFHLHMLAHIQHWLTFEVWRSYITTAVAFAGFYVCVCVLMSLSAWSW